MSPSAQTGEDSTPIARLAVLGGGAWGSVLAALLAQNGHDVALYVRTTAQADAWREARVDPRGRTTVHLPERVKPTADLAHALEGADGAFFVVPNAGPRALLEDVRSTGSIPRLSVSCSKGLFAPDLNRPSRLIEGMLGGDVAVLSGPNLAAEIAEGHPAAATVAHPNEARAAQVQGWLSSRRFRVYRDDDVLGVEVAGATKNVVALAAGMSDGLGLGENAKAALITRGLAEMIRLGEHLGGRPRTFYGLAGVGDLIATCASRASRNHSAGERMAKGEAARDVIASGITAEGIATAQAIDTFAETHGIRLPISRQVAAVTRDTCSAAQALEALLAGDARTEWTNTAG